MRSDSWWEGPSETLSEDDGKLSDAVKDVRRPVTIVEQTGRPLFSTSGRVSIQGSAPSGKALPVRGMIAALGLSNLGDPEFLRDHGICFPYVGGSMAHGISSTAISNALGQAGMLGFIGTAGQSPQWVEEAIVKMQSASPAIPYGFNLINSPNEPNLEQALVDLYIRRGVHLIEASAYLAITLPLVRFRLSGIRRGPDGEVVAPNRIIGKVSRVEVASKFFSPPPEKFVKEMVSRGELNPEQARMAAEIPMSQDITAEADSGGHTDNRPLVCLLPSFLALRTRLQAQFSYPFALRVGAAGGVASPQAAAGAFAMGAAYIVVGSVHQSCRESGTSEFVREMLAQAGQADVAMAPAGDMFEMGVNVQVLKRGTMFPMRAKKLYELYISHQRIEDIPLADRENIEKNFFRAPLSQIWEQTRQFFMKRDPTQVERAEKDPKHLMALVFRWYLGHSPKWAIAGDLTRKLDFQVWCGPAMGSFNEWVKGSHLESHKNRGVADVAMNLMYGAAVGLRAATLRAQGVALPAICFDVRPLPHEALKNLLEGA